MEILTFAGNSVGLTKRLIDQYTYKRAPLSVKVGYTQKRLLTARKDGHFLTKHTDMKLIIESVEADILAGKFKVMYYYDPIDDACRELFLDSADLQYQLPEEVREDCTKLAENEDGKWKYFDWYYALEYFQKDITGAAYRMTVKILHQTELS